MSEPIIGSLNEKSLHRSLKEEYLSPEAVPETKVDGYVIDVVKPDGLIEIQTGGFAGIRTKLSTLLQRHPVKLVHPVAAETLISVYSQNRELLHSRRSPKRCGIESAAAELLYLAELLPHPNLTVEILLVRQEEIRCDNGKGSWRRKGVSIEDRKLLEVTDRCSFDAPADYLRLLPPALQPPFGNRELAELLPSTGRGMRGRLRLAGQITYLLRKLNQLEIDAKDGNRLLFKQTK